ncbi:MAG: ABC transporter permease [Nitrospinae bacterium]|nr:ABC transporter permease [Nitrospinota bacterium]
MRWFAVFQRDLIKFFRNPIIIFVSILMPLLYLIILGNSFQGKLNHIPFVVVDQDNGYYSLRIRESLEALSAGPKIFKIAYMSDPVKAIQQVKMGIFSAALIIPPNFSKDVVLKNGPEVGLFTDNSDSISSDTVITTVHTSMQGLLINYIPVREDMNNIYLRANELYRKIDYDESLIPGIVIMAIFMGTLTSGAFNIVMDKFLGVHESYLVTPLTRRDMVTGIIISGVLLTSITALVVFGLSLFITGCQLNGGIKGIFLIILLIILTSLGLLSMMFIVLGRANHPRIVGIVAGFLNVILFFPSGAIYPISSFPGWLSTFSKINPETYAVHALRSLIFKGGDFSAIKNDFIFLILFTILMLLGAIGIFKRRL